MVVVDNIQIPFCTLNEEKPAESGKTLPDKREQDTQESGEPVCQERYPQRSRAGQFKQPGDQQAFGTNHYSLDEDEVRQVLFVHECRDGEGQCIDQDRVGKNRERFFTGKKKNNRKFHKDREDEGGKDHAYSDRFASHKEDDRNKSAGDY
jgi:hypothetical protein